MELIPVTGGRRTVAEGSAIHWNDVMTPALPWWEALAELCAARAIAFCDLDRAARLRGSVLPRGAIVDDSTADTLALLIGHRVSFENHWWIEDVDGPGTDTLVVRVSSSTAGTTLALLSFGSPDAATRHRAESLVPALVSIIAANLELHQELVAAKDEERAAIAALDCSDCGVVVLRVDGTIVFANTAAAALIDRGDGMHRHRGGLRPPAYPDAVRFQTALDCVISQPAGRGRRGAMMMMMPRINGERDMIVVIARTAEVEHEIAANGIAAVVYLVTPETATAAGLEPLCRLHGLSPVETKLVHHLVRGSSVAEAAGDMRIKVETARTYLKQVFVKMRVRRQSDLVRLLTRYQRAVRDDLEIMAA